MMGHFLEVGFKKSALIVFLVRLARCPLSYAEIFCRSRFGKKGFIFFLGHLARCPLSYDDFFFRSWFLKNAFIFFWAIWAFWRLNL